VAFEIAGELGLTIKETDITRHDVFVADECFLTGTAAELIPVIKADGRVHAVETPNTSIVFRDFL
jgi:branched-chain amino acid aminotransferase